MRGANIMFEYTHELLNKIQNKEELNHRDMVFIERSLKMQECNEYMLNEEVGCGDDDSKLFRIIYK